MNPPVFDIDPVAFKIDPYPVYHQMRNKAPICFVPQLGAILLTRRDDIFTCEKDIEIFSSEQPGGLMTVLMGENMMRKDGEAHMRERRMIFPTVSPKTVANTWKEQFELAADTILLGLIDRSEFDLVRDYAMPLSGEALKLVTGLTHVSAQAMNQWSQAMIDGIANYAGNPQIEAACHEATLGIDQAVSQRMEEVSKKPDTSLLSVLLQAGLDEAGVRANVKLAISGGQNEQRDALAGAVYAMLAHPNQLEIVTAGNASWMQVFDEYCRWMAPIGMSPRRIAKAGCYKGITLQPEQRAFLMFGAANRDEACFDQPDVFDVQRDTSKSIAFGAGPHFCAGAWISRCLVAGVGLPKLFEGFSDLRLAEGAEPRFEGWAFRGLPNLQVQTGRSG